MKKLAMASLILVLALVSLSAYLRLDHSGIGCASWPACYGNIGVPGANAPTVDDAYQRLLDEARQPLSWATPLHRLVASVLALMILANFLASLRLRRDRLLSATLLALTVFLAWLGIRSTSLHDPGIVMGNLAGGFSMLGGLGWLVFRKTAATDRRNAGLRIASTIAIVLLGAQIFVGGLTSANFAASACRTIPDCHGSWLPGSDLATAFDLSRQHRVGETGIVLGGPERADIHKLHRLAAVLTALAVVVAAVFAIRTGSDQRILGCVVLSLVIAEFGVGVAAILTDIPIGVAVAHNWLAALLLLALIRLLAESRMAPR